MSGVTAGAAERSLVMHTAHRHKNGRRWVRRFAAPVALALGLATVTAGVLAPTATAASSDACLEGGFSLVNLTTGATVATDPTEATVPASYGIVVSYLNRVGLAARDPFDCPMVNQYRRT